PRRDGRGKIHPRPIRGMGRDGVIVRKITAFEILWRARQPPRVNRRLSTAAQVSTALSTVNRLTRESGSHQTASSATQSVEFTYNLEKAANPRVGGPIRAARGTGEREHSWKSLIRHDSSLFR